MAALVVGGVSVGLATAGALPAAAATSSSEQWMTSAGPDITAVGGTMNLGFGTTGVSATVQATNSSGVGGAFPSTLAGFASQTNATDFLAPTPPADVAAAGQGVGQLNEGGSRSEVFTFNRPVIAPILHVVNLDGSTAIISGDTTAGVPITLTQLAKNDVMTVSGNQLNTNNRHADLGGCQANDGTNPNGGCGSFQLGGTSGLIKTFTLTNTGLYGDGWNWTLSFPTAPLTKAFNPTTIAAGGTSRLTFTITNPANPTQPTLTPLDFTDALPTGVTLADGTVTNNGDCGTPAVTDPSGGALAGGGTAVKAAQITVAAGATCTITVNVTAANPGSYTNNDSNLSTTVANLIPDADTTLTVVPVVGLSIHKSAGVSPYQPGATQTYTVTVKNAGPADAVGAKVSDPLPAALAGAGFTWTCTASAGSTCTATGQGDITDTVDVAAGGTLTYTVTGTVPVATTGTLSNTATVTPPPGTSDPACTPDCSSTVDTPAAAPGISVVKAASPASYTGPGQKVTYTFTVSNTGNVNLSKIVVKDTDFSGTGTLSAITCPEPSLAPGKSETCTATYETTQADVDAGSVTNTATATGTPPSGTPVTSKPSTATVTGPKPAPGISVMKSASPSSVAKVGQKVTYSFDVTNTGNVTLSEIAVKDTDFSGTGTLSAITCPDSSLAPGVSETCTATYTTTQADVDAGKVVNTATASGTDPSGTSVTSKPSTATVTVPKTTPPTSTAPTSTAPTSTPPTSTAPTSTPPATTPPATTPPATTPPASTVPTAVNAGYAGPSGGGQGWLVAAGLLLLAAAGAIWVLRHRRA